MSNGRGKKPPTGFVAICQCGVVVRALDYGRIDRETAGHMLHRWLDNGLTVEPRFANTWRVTVEACRCEPAGKNAKEGHE